MAGQQNPLNTPLYAAGSRFDIVARHERVIEGGHADVADDNGGETQYGISLRFLQAEGALDLDHDGHPDLDLNFDGDIDGADVRALTPIQAANLFFTCIWQRNGFDRLPLHIDAAVFDQSVNGGAVAAVKMLQRCTNNLNLTDPVDVDGVFGRVTMAAVSRVQRMNMANALLMHYRQAAESRYRAIVAASPTQAKFLNGWIARARSLGDV